jgi:hypothetical protein
MRRFIISVALAGAACAPLGAYAQAIDDPFSDYLERSDTISLGAGNAPETNATVQTITPWPPYVGDTRIRIDGRRAVDAVEQMHRVPNPFARGAGSSIGNPGPPASGSTGSGRSTSSGQPISSGN